MRIVLDCDPGHDDAFAILLAAASREIELLGVTTVVGNSYLENTTINARKILDLFDLDVPVFPGCAKPLLRNIVVAPQIHGQSGLDGATMPPPKRSIEKIHAVDFIAQMAQKYYDLILVPTGPLTNIALFILKYPKLVKRISTIVLMGGGIAFGNVTPVAEFNIFADAEAAKIVFKSGIPIVMAPLDLTHQVVATEREAEKLRSMGERFQIMADLLMFFKSTYKNVFNIDGAILHDPCTVMYLLHPEIFESQDYFVDVETKGELTYGQTVVDVWRTTGNTPNAKVLLKVNREKFFDILFEKFGSLSRR
ncbi:ribonucleoside hydrolase [Pseudothermotoga hypogea DSM 11164 = NBRC 106472]|uniref:Ribonucleoside hydrolase n=3 Tax=Pseudothermotoga TaxID=1643951 RepID=A0A0X1KSD9_9THEM|nr:nucleoside hydrolase [Pseudothermotoga hypogea]AJC74236.1 ribonucleoside hydrolase [Pseudothermotoga hypogea DSM 11164 = NBRC 106472]